MAMPTDALVSSVDGANMKVIWRQWRHNSLGRCGMASMWEETADKTKQAIVKRPDSIANRPAVKVPPMAGARPDAGMTPNAVKMPYPARAIGVMDLGFEG